MNFHYNGAHDGLVLKGVDLVAEPGQTVAILGATGAGKSSLVNLVPRFYDVAAGRITWNGMDVRDVPQSELLMQVGMVPQETVLFSGSVRDNIRYGRPTASEEEVIAAAKAAQAHDFIMSLADGYDTRIEERGVNLSGGQKQRIAIARALLLRPSILILDDSTSSVDVETETRIQDAMKERLRGSTTFVVAQRISTVLHADKIVVLDQGRIVAQGTHAELMRSQPGVPGDLRIRSWATARNSRRRHDEQPAPPAVPPFRISAAPWDAATCCPARIEQAANPRRALTRLALYLSPYMAALALVLAFVLIYILLQLLEPYLLGRAIDRYISTRQLAGLSQLALLLLTAYLFDNGFQAISSWLMARISQDALRRLRARPVRAPAAAVHRLLRRTHGGRADEPPDERHRCHQPGRLTKCGLAAGERAFAGRHPDRHVRAQPVAGAGGRAGGADHVLVHAVRGALHAQGLPPAAEGTGGDQRRDGRIHQRPACGQGLPAQRERRRAFPRQQSEASTRRACTPTPMP